MSHNKIKITMFKLTPGNKNVSHLLTNLSFYTVLLDGTPVLALLIFVPVTIVTQKKDTS